MKMKHLTALMALCALVGLVVEPLAAKSKKSARPVEHVVFIGLDGWGGTYAPQCDMPTVKRLLPQSAWTMQKRAVLPSKSAVNWASIFMGAGTELHGYTKWNSKTPELASACVNEHGIYPTIFSQTRATYPDAEIGVLYEWEGVKYVVDTLALSYFDGGIKPSKEPTKLVELAENYIKTKCPKLVAVVFDRPDNVGHSHGFGSPEYYAMMPELDGYIARIIEATKEAGIYDSTVFILAADHGGIEKNHGNASPEEMNTPFIMFGPGIPQGEIDEPMTQGDVTVTIAALLNVPPHKAWRGRAIACGR